MGVKNENECKTTDAAYVPPLDLLTNINLNESHLHMMCKPTDSASLYFCFAAATFRFSSIHKTKIVGIVAGATRGQRPEPVPRSPMSGYDLSELRVLVRHVFKASHSKNI